MVGIEGVNRFTLSRSKSNSYRFNTTLFSWGYRATEWCRLECTDYSRSLPRVSRDNRTSGPDLVSLTFWWPPLRPSLPPLCRDFGLHWEDEYQITDFVQCIKVGLTSPSILYISLCTSWLSETVLTDHLEDLIRVSSEVGSFLFCIKHKVRRNKVMTDLRIGSVFEETRLLIPVRNTVYIKI